MLMSIRAFDEFNIRNTSINKESKIVLDVYGKFIKKFGNNFWLGNVRSLINFKESLIKSGVSKNIAELSSFLIVNDKYNIKKLSADLKIFEDITRQITDFMGTVRKRDVIEIFGNNLFWQRYFDNPCDKKTERLIPKHGAEKAVDNIIKDLKNDDISMDGVKYKKLVGLLQRHLSPVFYDQNNESHVYNRVLDIMKSIEELFEGEQGRGLGDHSDEANLYNISEVLQKIQMRQPLGVCLPINIVTSCILRHFNIDAKPVAVMQRDTAKEGILSWEKHIKVEISFNDGKTLELDRASTHSRLGKSVIKNNQLTRRILMPVNAKLEKFIEHYNKINFQNIIINEDEIIKKNIYDEEKYSYDDQERALHVRGIMGIDEYNVLMKCVEDEEIKKQIFKVFNFSQPYNGTLEEYVYQTMDFNNELSELMFGYYEAAHLAAPIVLVDLEKYHTPGYHYALIKLMIYYDELGDHQKVVEYGDAILNTRGELPLEYFECLHLIEAYQDAKKRLEEKK